jgi:hypothetical protein
VRLFSTRLGDDHGNPATAGIDVDALDLLACEAHGADGASYFTLIEPVHATVGHAAAASVCTPPTASQQGNGFAARNHTHL